MSLTVMMTSAVSDLAQHTQRVALARGQFHRANIERSEKIQKHKEMSLSSVASMPERYHDNGADPFESGASIWDVLKTIRHANSQQNML